MRERTLYVTDLDGTLLSTRGVLAEAHDQKLRGLVRDRDLLLTYATARSHLMAALVAGPGWGTPAVVYNGAFTVDPADGTVLRSHLLDATAVTAAVAACRTQGLAPLVFDFDGVDHVQWVQGVEDPGVQRYLADRAGDRRFDPQERWSDLRCDHAFYVAVIGDDAAVAGLALDLRRTIGSRCTLNVQRDVYHPQDTWLEITPPAVTKASEVLALAAALGVARIVCFGDNNNDLSLFDIADEAYAVANATADVRDRATAVIGSNDDGGVVDWLERHAR